MVRGPEAPRSVACRKQALFLSFLLLSPPLPQDAHAGGRPQEVSSQLRGESLVNPEDKQGKERQPEAQSWGARGGWSPATLTGCRAKPGPRCPPSARHTRAPARRNQPALPKPQPLSPTWTSQIPLPPRGSPALPPPRSPFSWSQLTHHFFQKVLPL